MPIYIDPSIKELLDSELLSLLKWKSCFNIKWLEQSLERQIVIALDIWFKYYKDNWWI